MKLLDPSTALVQERVIVPVESTWAHLRSTASTLAAREEPKKSKSNMKQQKRIVSDEILSRECFCTEEWEVMLQV